MDCALLSRRAVCKFCAYAREHGRTTAASFHDPDTAGLQRVRAFQCATTGEMMQQFTAKEDRRGFIRAVEAGLAIVGAGFLDTLVWF